MHIQGSFTGCVFLIANDLVNAIGLSVKINQYRENDNLMITYRKYIGRIFGFSFRIYKTRHFHQRDWFAYTAKGDE